MWDIVLPENHRLHPIFRFWQIFGAHLTFSCQILQIFAPLGVNFFYAFNSPPVLVPYFPVALWLF